MKTIQTVLKLNIKASIGILLLLMIGLTNCSKNDDSAEVPKEEVKLSDEKQITSFIFRSVDTQFSIDAVAIIDEENKTIDITVPPDADVSSLLPEIKISEAASIDKTQAQNFSNPVLYVITAEDGSTATYTATAHFPLTQLQVLQVILDANPNNILSWDLATTTDLNNLNGIVTNSGNKITHLTLGESGITSLPEEIGQLSSLRYLYVGESQLTELPSEIGQLTNLEELYLHNNLITAIPDEIGNLSSLLFLGLDGNQLTTIPNTITKMASLEKLHLSSNHLTSFPSELSSMVNLTDLILSDNQLTTITTEIGALPNLNSLNLGGNNISVLPVEIGELSNLRYLSLYSNKLTSLPKEIGKLTALERLHINNNQLTIVPPEIGFLINLASLRLSENNITKLPSSVYYIKNFRNSTMEINHDFIQVGADTPLDALIGIYTANPGNTLDWGVDDYPEVSFHDNGDPKAITMNNKNLTRIPESISSLSGLESFNVNNNNLQSLPAALGSINSLGAITAASNQLSTVPSELGQLQNLALLSITNNPITSIPEEVCNQQISNGGILTILADPGEGCN